MITRSRYFAITARKERFC